MQRVGDLDVGLHLPLGEEAMRGNPTCFSLWFMQRVGDLDVGLNLPLGEEALRGNPTCFSFWFKR